ncbi:rRNA maturation RNase YbeY [Candidatus Uhrbacteria bacterium]|nr:rRNA maturation RNase YbeY [Candidatus Uhrbacteria bacterium]MBD3284312.1 rRNA maturation RNase YbeY [Candidatus Uhrbacteria bacterium]
MITITLKGALPRMLDAKVLPRIARECSELRAKTRSGTWTVGLQFVSASKIQELNRVYREKDGPTDVLSFPAADAPKDFPIQKGERDLGDIVICTSVVRKQAMKRDLDPAEEGVRILIHGILHLLGYDHCDDRSDKRMRGIQERILNRVV